MHRLTTRKICLPSNQSNSQRMQVRFLIGSKPVSFVFLYNTSLQVNLVIVQVQMKKSDSSNTLMPRSGSISGFQAPARNFETRIFEQRRTDRIEHLLVHISQINMASPYTSLSFLGSWLWKSSGACQRKISVRKRSWYSLSGFGYSEVTK